MRVTILTMMCLFTFTFTMAQEKELTLIVSQEQYNQLQKHFKLEQKIESKYIDWAKFYRYEELNDSISKPVSVVFIGNSITDRWYKNHSEFFVENDFTGRGIGGQTTSEMLVRFQSDVIDLQPETVVILAGINDIAQNNGIISKKHILQNIQSMCELAELHNIEPVLCSILPARRFNWNKELNPVQDILDMNKMIKQYAEENDLIYVDYYSAMVDKFGGLPGKYADDGVHPTLEGYSVMEPIILNSLKKISK
ncbi:GDSL-type esterase/lipase family protein [Sunxiuqinia sp. A32]|uniref:GDSL-type esterase/lipase family protein n=1 Tax=Sunxiuqinia sp. A32 TaxID=3461496 RepID=UPI004045B369